MEVTHGGQVISTLMDGELSSDEAIREFARIKSDGALREHWDTYHLIGDTLRGSRAGRPGFSARFSERLASEPTVLAPRSRPRLTGKVQTYALSAAASVAAVTVVGWAALNMLKPALPGAELAQNSAAPTAVAVQSSGAPVSGNAARVVAQNTAAAVVPLVPAEPAPLVAVPAEHVKEYLLAHQGISPTTAIQGVAPYVRTVSNTGE